MTDHSEHNSSILPIEGCLECDREIKRPIIRCHGLGKSTSVIPPPDFKENTEEDTNYGEE